MNKNLFLLPLFTSIPLYSMYTPVDLIKKYIRTPAFIKVSLNNYKQEELASYRDSNHSTLLHIMVTALIEEKDHVTDLDTTINNYKQIVKYLVDSGINVNEVDNNHNTPLALLYQIRTNNNDDRFLSLENYMEIYFDADPNCFSIMPEFRACKKLFQFLCCNCIKYKQS